MDETYQELSLSVGETIRVGNELITVVDILDDEIIIRIDPVEEASLANPLFPPAFESWNQFSWPPR
jgi:hypothetical protein